MFWDKTFASFEMILVLCLIRIHVYLHDIQFAVVRALDWLRRLTLQISVMGLGEETHFIFTKCENFSCIHY